ncbi:MAG: hypothetical protein AUJ92_15670 [Armatimonadetes bacterium CG2_30_59_28]|nr:MAG: hypothetical protein AUJ92_15670 [Armatimonadetes bacterium CG2_30_59_28]PIU63841.1 MAG: hypothetical protein COS85_14815 [Armatimonadetes bacterium CG07_land_8_20_14_0_80_59_28]
MLVFPGVSFYEETLDDIVAEGFDDIALFFISKQLLQGQGYSVDRARPIAEAAHRRGLGIVVYAGYQKYEERLLARDPQRAMVTRGIGQALDSDSLPSNWLCPFQPANRERHKRLLDGILTLPGIREIYLNDEALLGFADGTIGCYCDYCRSDFQSTIGQEPPQTPNWSDDVWWRWIEYRMSRWTEVHAEFRDYIHASHPEVFVGIQHSPIVPCRCWHPWKTGINVAADAQALDAISTDPYHFNHDRVIAHRPHRRILAEGTRNLVGACVSRRVSIIPQGFMPPAQAAPMGRQDGLLAGIVPFALGAASVSPFTYELAKIIPGFFEGFQDARRLYSVMQTHNPYAFVTVLSPLQSEIYGHPDSDWGNEYVNEIPELMYRTGLPWRWVWDQRLPDSGPVLSGPLIVPDAHCLTAAQMEAMNDSNSGVLWIGNTPAEVWPGAGVCPLPHPFEQGRYALDPAANHWLFNGIDEPVVLHSRSGEAPFDGEAVGWVDGKPSLVIREDNARREAWIAGLLAPQDHEPAGIGVLPTGNLELLRRLLFWLGRVEPLVRLDPWPALDAYRAIRPADRRNVPTAELLPMTSGDSLLAIIFPYTPVSLQTDLVIHPPLGRRSATSVRELWRGGPLELEGNRVALNVPGDTELLAILIEWSR